MKIGLIAGLVLAAIGCVLAGVIFGPVGVVIALALLGTVILVNLKGGWL